ncbi:MAG: hypothetical protein WBN86_10140 [Porticoccaceae bacterium]
MTKRRPLTAHALAELRDLANKPCPRQAVNPGVANKLLSEGLVESVMLPSPYRTHRGNPLEHLRITDIGRQSAGLMPKNY